MAAVGCSWLPWSFTPVHGCHGLFVAAMVVHARPWLPWLFMTDKGPLAVLSFGPSASLHPPPLRFACGYPLTAAGGQGPQDNTAYGLAYPLLPTSCCTSPLRCMFDGWDRKQYCPSDLPLRSIPPAALRLRVPAYGRGCTVRDHRLAYGLGPSTCVRFWTIDLRTVRDHRRSHGGSFFK